MRCYLFPLCVPLDKINCNGILKWDSFPRSFHPVISECMYSYFHHYLISLFDITFYMRESNPKAHHLPLKSLSGGTKVYQCLRFMQLWPKNLFLRSFCDVLAFHFVVFGVVFHNINRCEKVFT